jgi:hypothetical protein
MNNIDLDNFQDTENYAGCLFTILDSKKVYDIICISETEGYSELLENDPEGEPLAYILPDSDYEDYSNPWYIYNSYIRELLECNAITLTKEETTND